MNYNKNFIWIIGNVGAGKTSLCLSLSKFLIGYKHLNIDQYRIEDSTEQSNDLETLKRFYSDMRNHEKIILESVGTYGLSFRNYNWYIIRLDNSLDKSIERVRNRSRNLTASDMNNWEDTSVDYVASVYNKYDKFKKIDPHFVINTDFLTKEEVLTEVIFNLKKDGIL